MATVRVSQAALALPPVVAGSAGWTAVASMSVTANLPATVRVSQAGLALAPAVVTVRVSQASLTLLAAPATVQVSQAYLTLPTSAVVVPGDGSWVATAAMDIAAVIPQGGYRVGYTNGYTTPPPPILDGLIDLVASSSMSITGSASRDAIEALTATAAMRIAATGNGTVSVVLGLVAQAAFTVATATGSIGAIDFAAASVWGASVPLVFISHSGTSRLTSIVQATSVLTSPATGTATITSG